MFKINSYLSYYQKFVFKVYSFNVYEIWYFECNRQEEKAILFLCNLNTFWNENWIGSDKSTVLTPFI